jgi:hypothetical protein
MPRKRAKRRQKRSLASSPPRSPSSFLKEKTKEISGFISAVAPCAQLSYRYMSAHLHTHSHCTASQAKEKKPPTARGAAAIMRVRATCCVRVLHTFPLHGIASIRLLRVVPQQSCVSAALDVLVCYRQPASPTHAPEWTPPIMRVSGTACFTLLVHQALSY